MGKGYLYLWEDKSSLNNNIVNGNLNNEYI